MEPDTLPDDRPVPSLGATENSAAPVRSPDYRAIFDASPTPLLVIAPPDWTIVAANEARLKATDTTRKQNIGRKLFDVFPDDPTHPEADGVRNLTLSLERVLATKKADLMAVQRYALSDANGVFVERW
jgi:PAS domain-containing protein